MLGTHAEVQAYATGIRAVRTVITDGCGGVVAYHIADDAQLTEYHCAVAALVTGTYAELCTEVLQGAGLKPCALPAIGSKVLQARKGADGGLVADALAPGETGIQLQGILRKD